MSILYRKNKLTYLCSPRYNYRGNQILQIKHIEIFTKCYEIASTFGGFLTDALNGHDLYNFVNTKIIFLTHWLNCDDIYIPLIVAFNYKIN